MAEVTGDDASSESVAGSGSGEGTTAADETTTWLAVWNETADVIGDRQHARWMCETASSTDPDEFLAVLDVAPMARMMQHLDAMVTRYRTGEPLQYVLGRWSFRCLDLAVDSRALIPRPETELVAEIALSLAKQCVPTRTVVDLGTGTGAIGLSLADELPVVGTTVWITDVDADALQLAAANLTGIGRGAQNVRIRRGSWFDALPDDVVADVIVSNPPYVAVDSPDLESIVERWEPPVALFAGPDGLDALRLIIGGASAHLVPGGWIVLEIGSGQGAAVSAMLDGAGFMNIDIESDAAGHDRIAVAQRPGPL